MIEALSPGTGAIVVVGPVSTAGFIFVFGLLLVSGLGGLACTLIGHDILFDVKKIAGGDSEYEQLFWKFPFPGKRWSFLRDLLIQHEQLYPRSHRRLWLKVSLTVQFLSFLCAVAAVLCGAITQDLNFEIETHRTVAIVKLNRRPINPPFHGGRICTLLAH